MVADRFVEGMLAGFGIAIPVGAIAILILEKGLSEGLAAGLASGAGAASADFLYAALAAMVGEYFTQLLAPVHSAVQLLSGLFLLVLGLRGILRAGGRIDGAEGSPKTRAKGFKNYLQFLALTLLNPLTLAYFTALILGRDPSDQLSLSERIAFSFGAGSASLLWQSVLAFLGAYGMRRLGKSFQSITIAAGNLIVIAIALNLLIHIFLQTT